MRARAPVAAALLLCAAPLAYGQGSTDKNVATRAQIIDEMVANGVLATKSPIPIQKPFQTTFGTGGNESIAAYLIAAHADRAGYRALLDAMEARTDKQVG